MEDFIAGAFLLALAVVPLMEIVLRKITGSGLVWSSGFLQHIVVWVAWLGGMAASREHAHLSLGSSVEPGKGWLGVLDRSRDMMASGINAAFAVASASFLVIGFAPGESVGAVPIRLALAILPLGYAFMALRSIRGAWYGKILGLVLGLFFSWPSVVNLLATANPNLPFFFYDLSDLWYQLFQWLRWPLVILLLVLAVRGLPIFLVLGGTALFLFSGNWGALESLPNEAYVLLTGSMIPAIPLFTVTGFLLSESSSGKRLVRFFRAWLGWLPGGLAVVAVVACAYFTTFTGASGVTILALGGLLVSVLEGSRQYGRDFSRGLVTSSGSVGLLFPPALPIIMYGVTAQVSIKDMFLGGLLPGVLLVAVLSAMGIYRAIKHSKERVPFDIHEALQSLRFAALDLLLPVVLLVAYFTGLTNLVETAALSAVYALFITFAKKELTLSLVIRVLRRCVPVVGGVLVILAMAKGLNYFIVDAQVPTMLTAFFRENVSSPYVFLILLNLALLVTGTLMDIFSAILVVAPLIIPLGELYGIHPVQLGVIFLANLQLGYLTPPVGMNLFLASYTFEEPMSRVYKQVLPFMGVLMAAVLLITYVPWFSLALLG